jgi:ABC-2 type transport system ATP-binding protein
VEELCDHVAVIHKGIVAAAGPLAAVRGDLSLEATFVRLVRGRDAGAIPQELAWLPSSSA